MRSDGWRAHALVLVLSLVAYANSLGNGFAYDDSWFIADNPVVTEGRFADAFTQAAWPGAVEGTGNYRPITLSSFAVEWSLWGGSTVWFHLVSVLAHGVASLLSLALLRRFLPAGAALIGALLFAVHPVHTEAVANVMGRAELYAAIGYFSACLLYLNARPSTAVGRGARLLGLVGLFLLAAGSKEIAVTLPAMLVALEVFRPDERPVAERLRAEGATYVGLLGVLGIYVLVRWSALGDLTGESPAAGLLALTPRERVLTALTMWPQYLRLLVFPLDLVADYGPGVIQMTRTVTLQVVAGASLLAGALFGAVALRRRAPAVGLALAWFVIAISPVSNLLVRSDILLAERTLYLPSLAVCLVAGALAARVGEGDSAAVRRVAVPIGAAVGLLLLARTIDRNPAWKDTFTALNTLAVEHPESWLSHRAHAVGLAGIGEMGQAAERFGSAIAIAPDHYQLLIEAASHYHQMGRHDRAEELLAQAIAVQPRHREAYRQLAEQRLLRREGRLAHAAALAGLRNATDHEVLWALVSESYVLKGDLEAAVRARRAALARNRAAAASWDRLAELLDAMGREAEAREARRQAAAARGGQPDHG